MHIKSDQMRGAGAPGVVDSDTANFRIPAPGASAWCWSPADSTATPDASEDYCETTPRKRVSDALPGMVIRTLRSGASIIATRGVGQHDLLMRLREARETSKPEGLASQGPEPPRIRGLLLVYFVALTFFFVHNSFLTVGSIVVYGHSSAAGSHHTPPGSLVYYIISNVTLLVYVLYVFVLMKRRRRSAIIHNIIFNILSVVFLVTWHAIGEKSTTGMIVDSIPNLVIIVYFLLSRRVRKTFAIDSDGRSIA
jgi:hypothetical protein